MSYFRLDDERTRSRNPSNPNHDRPSPSAHTTDNHSNLAPSPHIRQPASLWARLFPIISSLTATSLSCIPISLQWRNFYFPQSSPLFSYTVYDSPTLQVFVSIIASVISFLWVYSATSAFNRATRIRLAEQRNVMLDSLRLSIAINGRTVDWNLPVGRLSIALIWWVIALVPVRLWTGALTPQIRMVRVDIENAVLVPTTSELNQDIYQRLQSYDPAQQYNVQYRNRNTLTNAPGQFFSGRLLDTISTATPPNGTLRNHTKYDNSTYSYQGRSFGAGAFVGLTDLPVDAIEFYNFTETGLVATANCIRNETSAWGAYTAVTNYDPRTYHVGGYRPNQPPASDPNNGYAWGYKQFAFPVDSKITDPNLDHPSGIVSFSAGSASGYFNGTAPYYLSITASDGTAGDGTNRYNILNQTQCQLSFNWTPLNVNVSLIDHTIRVTPLDSQGEAPLSEAQGNYIEWTLRSLQAITMIQTSNFLSTVGEAINDNLLQLNDSNLRPPHPAGLKLVSDSVEAALDDIMAVQNAYALTKTAGSQTIEGTLYIRKVEVGNQTFRTALFVTNMLTFVVIVVVCAYTRMFKDSPAFDYTDLGSVAAGACHQFTDLERRSDAAYLGDWSGDAGDRMLRESQLEFQIKAGVSGAPIVLFKQSGGQIGPHSTFSAEESDR